VIKYIGSKRRLVPRIVEIARGLPGARTVLDLFSGTTRVAQGLKMAGFQVTANDQAS
jgi:adenine-specific DNA-methyltransferase